MSEEIRKYMSLMESFYTSSPYGQQSQGEDDKETVTYTKTKKQGDNTVTVSANADSMDELHDILKLAGITLPKGKDSEEPEAHDREEHSEVETCDSCGKPADECECEGHDHGEEEKPKMKVISLKPKAMGYNSIGGDKKEILNALMNRYKSL